MKLFHIGLFCLFGFCFIDIPAFAHEEIPTDMVQMTDAARSIVVQAKSPEFEINLPANATTGYRWLLLDDVVKRFYSIRQSYQPFDHGQKLGSGGVDTWHFKLSQSAFKYPHVIQLHFTYAQPWEISGHDMGSTAQKVFTVVILNDQK